MGPPPTPRRMPVLGTEGCVILPEWRVTPAGCSGLEQRRWRPAVLQRSRLQLDPQQLLPGRRILELRPRSRPAPVLLYRLPVGRRLLGWFNLLLRGPDRSVRAGHLLRGCGLRAGVTVRRRRRILFPWPDGGGRVFCR